MGYALILGANTLGVDATDANGATTDAIDTTGADIICIGITGFGTASRTVSDSQSNTWTALTKYNASLVNVQIFYCQNPTTNGSHTFTVSGTTTYTSIGVAAFSGSATTPFDVENGNGDASSPLSVGSITPTEDGELVFFIGGLGGTGDFSSVDTGTLLDHAAGVDAKYVGSGIAYYIQPTAAAVNPQMTWSGGSNPYGCIASFKAAAVGAAANPWYYYAQH